MSSAGRKENKPVGRSADYAVAAPPSRVMKRRRYDEHVALTAPVGRLLEDNEQRDHDERRDHQWMDRCRAIRPTISRGPTRTQTALPPLRGGACGWAPAGRAAQSRMVERSVQVSFMCEMAP